MGLTAGLEPWQWGQEQSAREGSQAGQIGVVGQRTLSSRAFLCILTLSSTEVRHYLRMLLRFLQT